jgi:hypothetical protein
MSVVASLLTVRMCPDVTSSLVGLAVNYTLLIPIYLNWVVKFLADMEMYMGAVERVQQYALTPTEDYRLRGASKKLLFTKEIALECSVCVIDCKY